MFLRNLALFLFVSQFQIAYGLLSNQESSLKCHLAEAKKIIVDVIPGEENLAEKMLINCIRTNPKYLDPILTLAKFIEQQVSSGEKPVFEIQKSLALVSQAYAMEPNNPEIRYTMVHLFRAVGKYEDAQNLYENTLKEFPNSKESLIEKAKLEIENNPEKALEFIEKSVAMGTNVDDIIDVILSCVRYKSSLNTYSKILSLEANKFQNRWLYHKLGLVYLEEKNYIQAEESFIKAISLGNNIESKLQLAILQYENLAKYKQSVLNFEKLIHHIQNEKIISTSSLALVNSHYAIALYLDNKLSKSLDAAIQVIKLSVENRDYIKSLVYEFKSRNALYILKPALELVTLNDPSFDLAYAYLSEIYKQEKNYEKALNVLDKAIILNPKNDSFFAMRGSVYYKMSKFNDALKNFNSALELTPGSPSYLYNKACILSLLGKKKEALVYLKSVLNSDLNFVQIAKNDSDFNAIKLDDRYAQEFALLFFENYDGKWASTDSVP